MAYPRAGHNWAMFDEQALVGALRDRHAGLSERAKALIAAGERMPPVLGTAADIAKAGEFAAQIKGMIAQCIESRRQDKSPFNDANRTVGHFFAAIEQPLEALLREVLARLTRAHDEARIERRLTEDGGTPLVSVADRTVIAADLPREPALAREAARRIPTVVEVGFIDRASLDLEALREVFSDRELDAAVARHLRQNGPTLRGVRYRDVAAVIRPRAAPPQNS